ncbi:hypothetical protein Airi02_104180 [Actinoallomurus iriomotensis]|uniref:Uncharacterized protein n=1 Tax=Actinoallomurus iriomotensis TaxID=478107 RepID=A0A9W6SCW4_9ACTN|nr:hypothetical protein Airi02_104180 [Actinoallomurus iriomotensis]
MPGPGAMTAAGGGAAVATRGGVAAAAVIVPASATMIKGVLTIDNRTFRVRSSMLTVTTFDWEPP